MLQLNILRILLVINQPAAPCHKIRNPVTHVAANNQFLINDDHAHFRDFRRAHHAVFSLP